MPSGSRKRKAQKKPRPGEPPSLQGEPPELEPGLEESMAKEGEEMVEGSPSPKAMDGVSQAMAEEWIEVGDALAVETPGAENEVAKGEQASAAPDHPTVYTTGFPSQTEPVSEVSELEATGENELEGETPDIAQGDPLPPIKNEKTESPGETSRDSEALPVEINPDTEPDAEVTPLERERDGAGAPLIGITPKADRGESTDGALDEIGGETQVGNESGIYESPVELERMAALVQEETGTEAAVDDLAAMGIDPAVDETPEYAQQEIDEATGADTDAASANIEPESTDVAPVVIAAETNNDPTRVQSEVDKSVVETLPEEDAAAKNLDMDPGLGAAPADAQLKMDKDPGVGEVEADAPSADFEPKVKNDASLETEAEMDSGTTDAQSGREEADQRQLETLVVPSSPEAENELENEVAYAGEDALMGEIDQEVEPVVPIMELQTDFSESEIQASPPMDSVPPEPEPELTLRGPESGIGRSFGEFKPEVSAAMGDFEKDEVDEAETKSEANAAPIDAEQNETAPVATQLEPGDRASREVEPEVEIEKLLASLEADTDALKESESEPERTGPTRKEVEEKADLSEGVETPVEADTEPTNGALTEASEEISKDELNQGVKTFLEAETEPKGDATCVYEAEAEAEVPDPEPEVEPSSDIKPDEEGSIETESDQQDSIVVEPDRPYIQDQEQQQERETDSAVEGPECPAIEANQEEFSAGSASLEAGLGGFSALSAQEKEAPAISGPRVTGSVPQTLEECGVASPSEVAANDGAHAADGVVVDTEEGTDEPKKGIIQQESQGAEDELDQERASFGEFHTSTVSSEQDLEAEQQPTITAEEVTLEEEPRAAETESILHEKQDLTTDPRILDMPSDVSEVVEQGLSTPLAPVPKDEVTFEHEQTPSEGTEKDSGEEEAALSTVAETGSVANDFDESASDQQLPTDFLLSGRDEEVSESRGFDDTSLTTPELIAAGLPEQIYGESKDFDRPSSPRAPEQVGGGHADSGEEDIKVSLATVRGSPKEEVEWKVVQDLGPPPDHEDVSPESEDPATTMLESHIELPVDVHPPEESAVSDEEEDVVEAKDGDNPPTLGIVPALESLALAKEELNPKILPSNFDGLRRLPSSETPTCDLSTPGVGGGNHNNPVVMTENSEIDISETKDSEAVASGQALMNTSNGSPLLSTSPGEDIEDVQAFRQQKTQEASLPVVIPAQDVKQRSLEQGNFQGNEQPSKGGTLQRRTNLLGCCGLFDVLLGNK